MFHIWSEMPVHVCCVFGVCVFWFRIVLVCGYVMFFPYVFLCICGSEMLLLCLIECILGCWCCELYFHYVWRMFLDFVYHQTKTAHKFRWICAPPLLEGGRGTVVSVDWAACVSIPIAMWRPKTGLLCKQEKYTVEIMIKHAQNWNRDRKGGRNFMQETKPMKTNANGELEN
jgi:hypothetical protein